jgi:hypothetical protein
MASIDTERAGWPRENPDLSQDRINTTAIFKPVFLLKPCLPLNFILSWSTSIKPSGSSHRAVPLNLAEHRCVTDQPPPHRDDPGPTSWRPVRIDSADETSGPALAPGPISRRLPHPLPAAERVHRAAAPDERPPDAVQSRHRPRRPARDKFPSAGAAPPSRTLLPRAFAHHRRGSDRGKPTPRRSRRVLTIRRTEIPNHA